MILCRKFTGGSRITCELYKSKNLLAAAVSETAILALYEQ